VRVRNKLILWNNRRRYFVRVEIRNRIPTMVLHSKYESNIKWLLRTITLVAVLSSVVSLAWYLSLVLAAFLVAVEQILERIVFKFGILYVQPLIEWRSEEWLGMTFGFPVGKGPLIVGMFFRSQEYARELFQRIKTWNYDQDEDHDDNIRISFIIESNSEYSTYVYPSLERKSIKLFKEKVQEEVVGKSETKESEMLITSPVICKSFGHLPNSNFSKFRSLYKAGDPYLFGAYYVRSKVPELEEGRPFLDKKRAVVPVSGVAPVMKYHLKIADRSKLTKRDLEYHHGRFIMEK